MLANRLDHKTQCILGEMWREACDRGTRLRFKVVSGSMSPMIEVGDVVKVSRAEPSTIRIGDIVAFQDGQNVVVHRVISKSWYNQQLSFRHMGDAGACSGRIATRNLIGRVTVIEKDGREIRLDSRRLVIGNRILGWRLRFVDILGRMQYRHISMGLQAALRPMWRLCRRILFWRL